jgi:aspartate/methionine/tyrosine aminotransferase
MSSLSKRFPSRSRISSLSDTDRCWVAVHHALCGQLLDRHGIVVRDGDGFGLPGVARVAVPDDGGPRLAAVLERVLR